MNTPSLALQLARNIPELIAFVAGIDAQGGVTNTLNRIAGAGFVSTTGAPANSAGVNGQYALDVANSVIYGPKAGGVWPAGVSFKGVAPTFTAGTANTLPSGTPATITVTPTGPNSYSISVGIPRGASGAGTGDLLSTNNLSDLANISTARTNLGLGTLATQNANNVNITGGTVAPSVDIAIADGGTGASSAPAARSNLGIPAFGTAAGNLAPLDSNGYAPASTVNPANVVLSVAGLAGSVTAADLRAAAMLRPGTDIQTWDADLDALAAIGGNSRLAYRGTDGIWRGASLGAGLNVTTGTSPTISATALRQQDYWLFQNGNGYTSGFYWAGALSEVVEVVAYQRSIGVFKHSSGSVTAVGVVPQGQTITVNLAAFEGIRVTPNENAECGAKVRQVS